MPKMPTTNWQQTPNLVQSLAQQAQREVNVVFATDQFANALAALKLAQSTSVTTQQDVSAHITAASLREIWRKDQERLAAAISTAIVQGEAHIDAVLNLFDLK